MTNRVLVYLGADAESADLVRAARRRRAVTELCGILEFASAGALSFWVSPVAVFANGEGEVVWSLTGDVDAATIPAVDLQPFETIDRFRERVVADVRSLAGRLLLAADAVEGGVA
jgi:hypothetical protein